MKNNTKKERVFDSVEIRVTADQGRVQPDVESVMRWVNGKFERRERRLDDVASQ